MFNVVYTNILKLFERSQKRLLGFSVLYVFLSAAVMLLSLAVPIVGITIVLILSCGMHMMFLSAYLKKEIKTEMLFSGFENIKHVAVGMLWAFFKIIIWLLVPVAGVFFAVAKAYEYRFVPHILITRPEISPIDACDVSKNETDGFKTNMFLTDAAIVCAVILIELVFYFISLIPVIGIVFAATAVAISIVSITCFPFAKGIISAMFYTEIQQKTLKPQKKTIVCPCCMSKIGGNDSFCPNCGEHILQCVKKA